MRDNRIILLCITFVLMFLLTSCSLSNRYEVTFYDYVNGEVYDLGKVSTYNDEVKISRLNFKSVEDSISGGVLVFENDTRIGVLAYTHLDYGKRGDTEFDLVESQIYIEEVYAENYFKNEMEVYWHEKEKGAKYTVEIEITQIWLKVGYQITEGICIDQGGFIIPAYNDNGELIFDTMVLNYNSAFKAYLGEEPNSILTTFNYAFVDIVSENDSESLFLPVGYNGGSLGSELGPEENVFYDFGGHEVELYVQLFTRDCGEE